MTYPLAIQLYTLRHVSDDLGELVRISAEAGYAGVEGGYGPGLEAEELRDVLAEHGVKMVSAHVALDALETNLEDAVRYQKTLGNDTIILPWLDKSLFSDTRESWEALAKRLTPIAEKLQDKGMTFLYHNHSFEFDKYEEDLALEVLLDNTPSMGLELDIGWCQEGGVDPLMLLEKYSGQVSRIHVKDRAPEGQNVDQGGWADVGDGVIDWGPILKAAQGAGCDWFIVEHDEPADPLQTAKRSFDYLSKL